MTDYHNQVKMGQGDYSGITHAIGHVDSYSRLKVHVLESKENSL